MLYSKGECFPMTHVSVASGDAQAGPGYKMLFLHGHRQKHLKAISKEMLQSFHYYCNSAAVINFEFGLGYLHHSACDGGWLVLVRPLSQEAMIAA